jgi:CDP-glycerol glycerophosphotransferase (TagB/SpsB family)
MHRIILFCQRAYSFSILRPLEIAARARNVDVLWYVGPAIVQRFPYRADSAVTSSIAELEGFAADAIFVPGNDVPYYLRGVKAQIFHGFAGEKKGHFRIRGYFDLYLTQGPYFTCRFEALRARHRNFDVAETGWPKLDQLFDGSINTAALSAKYCITAGRSVVLYAPTFSPSLTSAQALLRQWQALAATTDWVILIKFHPLMEPAVVQEYRNAFAASANIHIVDDDDITPLLMIADVMVSDTSSVVYEFLLLDKPVVTYKSSARDIHWCDIDTPQALESMCREALAGGRLRDNPVKDAYHPYTDGQSAARMLDAVEAYIRQHSVPDKRSLNWFRRRKIHKIYGAPGRSASR